MNWFSVINSSPAATSKNVSLRINNIVFTDRPSIVQVQGVKTLSDHCSMMNTLRNNDVLAAIDAGKPVRGELQFRRCPRLVTAQTTTVGLCAGSRPGRGTANLRLLTVGKLPGSVRTRYDLLGNLHPRASPVCLLITTTYKCLNAFGRQGPEVHTEAREARRQTYEVRSAGPSGVAASPSSHPDQ